MTNDSMTELEAAFSNWRRDKQYPKERIPDALLARARRAASAHGVGPVAYRLRVAASRLTIDAAAAAGPAVPALAPTFTRLEIAAPLRASQPLAEAETPAGLKLRVFQITAETASLLSSFCRAGGAT